MIDPANLHCSPPSLVIDSDRESLLTFYDLSPEHWEYLRTTNLIESVFAIVERRTVCTNGSSLAPPPSWRRSS